MPSYPDSPATNAGAALWARAIVTPGGYLWWYFDVLTPEGDGLCCIFFAGSVFSPSYAVRLRLGEQPMPTEHCAVNLVLYRRGKKASWVLSEYESLGTLDEDHFAVGSSTVRREGDRWIIDIREHSAPFGTRVEGTITVEALAHPWTPCAIGGDHEAGHGWQAVAPRARITARFTRPDFSVEGVGYHDRNYGCGRLEDAFSRWGWARFHGEHKTTVLYVFTDRGGVERALWLSGEDHATTSPIPVEEQVAEHGQMRRLMWGMRLPVSFGVGQPEHLRCVPGRLLESAPFYARFQAQLFEAGTPTQLGVGEFLDLDGFRHPVKQFLLRYLTRPVFRDPLW